MAASLISCLGARLSDNYCRTKFIKLYHCVVDSSQLLLHRSHGGQNIFLVDFKRLSNFCVVMIMMAATFQSTPATDEHLTSLTSTIPTLCRMHRARSDQLLDAAIVLRVSKNGVI